MKQRLLALTTLLLPTAAFAHGDLKPQHGGQIHEGKVVTVEVTIDPSMTMVYLTDHGKPVDSKGASGELTLLNSGAKSTIALSASGGNSLMGTGAKLSAGAKAIVKVKVPGKGEDQARVSFP